MNTTGGTHRITDIWSDTRLIERRIDEGNNGTIDVICDLVYGNELDEVVCMLRNGVEYYPLCDAQGSTLALLDATGTVVEKYSYSPFGQPSISTVGQSGTSSKSAFDYPFLFHGQQWDSECQAYYARARFYDPSVGRFLTPDPTGASDGRNLYVYCRNDPINNTDPSGLQTPDNHWNITYKNFYPKAYNDAMEATKRFDPTGQFYGIRDNVAKYVADYRATVAADAAKAWDKDSCNPGTQDEANAHLHGTRAASAGISREKGFENSWGVITDRLSQGTDAGIGEAMHVAQDLVSEGHRLKEYSGLVRLILDDIETTVTEVLWDAAKWGAELFLHDDTADLPDNIGRDDPHWLGDLWPDPSTEVLMDSVSTMLVEGDLDTAMDVLAVVLHVDGDSGSAKYEPDGSVTVTMNDGSSVTMSEKDKVVKSTPEKQEPSEPAPPKGGCYVNDWSIVPDPFPVFPHPPLIPLELDPQWNPYEDPNWSPYDPADRRPGPGG